MIPLVFNPVAPATQVPPQVAIAYAVFLAFQGREVGRGDNWKGGELTPEEAAAKNAAMRVLSQFAEGEHYQPAAQSDFARVGLCEWEDLPQQVQIQLQQNFHPAWKTREANQRAFAAMHQPPQPEVDLDKIREQIEEMIKAGEAATKSRKRSKGKPQ